MKLHLVLVNSMDAELDSVDMEVRDPESCEREVMAVLNREKWVLSVGDRIEIREPQS